MDFVFPITNCGMCSVPEQMIEQAQFSMVKYLNGHYLPIDKINGHLEVSVNEIRLVQIAWLFKNRKIDYAFLDEKKEKLALGVKA